MRPKGNAFFKIVLLFVVFTVLAACAPKKIRLYGLPDPTRNSVVVSALALQGKPYRNGAKGPDAFDCSGLVYYVFKQQRVSMPPPAEMQGHAGREIGQESVQPGDLVFFKIKGDFHVGIMVNGGEFVHASSSKGVAVDSVGAVYWQKRLVGFRSVL
jgi:peptidoglycan DL-endopeptidase CwlO